MEAFDQYIEGLYRAFCTVHWYATGEYIIHESRSSYSDEFWRWYISIENKLVDKEYSEDDY